MRSVCSASAWTPQGSPARPCSVRACAADLTRVSAAALPTVALPVNATATARVQYDSVHNSIELHLCGAEHCSSVVLTGAQPDGTLGYSTWTGCNRLGRGGSYDKVSARRSWAWWGRS